MPKHPGKRTRPRPPLNMPATRKGPKPVKRKGKR